MNDVAGYTNVRYYPTDQTYLGYTEYAAKDASTQPKAVMGKQYVVPSFTDMPRLDMLLDQRVQYTEGLKLLSHYSHNANVHVAYWEFPLLTLEKECNERRRSPITFVQLTKFFSDSEVWLLIRMLCLKNIEYCKKFSRYFGDIQPKLIMIRDAGDIYFNDILNYNPREEDGYRRMLHNNSWFSPQGPQACEEINKRIETPAFDRNKNDVFSIGITVLAVITDSLTLEAALKTFYSIQMFPPSLSPTAEYKRIVINFDAIHKTLSAAEQTQKRSPLLINVLRIMLSPKEDDRPTLYQVLEFLKIASA